MKSPPAKTCTVSRVRWHRQLDRQRISAVAVAAAQTPLKVRVGSEFAGCRDSLLGPEYVGSRTFVHELPERIFAPVPCFEHGVEFSVACDTASGAPLRLGMLRSYTRSNARTVPPAPRDHR